MFRIIVGRFSGIVVAVLALSACNHPASPSPQQNEGTSRPVSVAPLPVTLRLMTEAGGPTRMWATLKEATLIEVAKNPGPFDLDCNGDCFVYLMEIGVDGSIKEFEKAVFQIYLQDDFGGQTFLEIGTVSAVTASSVMVGGGTGSGRYWPLKGIRPTHLAVSAVFGTTVLHPPIEEGSTRFDLQR